MASQPGKPSRRSEIAGEPETSGRSQTRHRRSSSLVRRNIRGARRCVSWRTGELLPAYRDVSQFGTPRPSKRSKSYPAPFSVLRLLRAFRQRYRHHRSDAREQRPRELANSALVTQLNLALVREFAFGIMRGQSTLYDDPCARAARRSRFAIGECGAVPSRRAARGPLQRANV